MLMRGKMIAWDVSGARPMDVLLLRNVPALFSLVCQINPKDIRDPGWYQTKVARIQLPGFFHHDKTLARFVDLAQRFFVQADIDMHILPVESITLRVPAELCPELRFLVDGFRAFVFANACALGLVDQVPWGPEWREYALDPGLNGFFHHMRQAAGRLSRTTNLRYFARVLHHLVQKNTHEHATVSIQ